MERALPAEGTGDLDAIALHLTPRNESYDSLIWVSKIRGEDQSKTTFVFPIDKSLVHFFLTNRKIMVYLTSRTLSQRSTLCLLPPHPAQESLALK